MSGNKPSENSTKTTDTAQKSNSVTTTKEVKKTTESLKEDNKISPAPRLLVLRNTGVSKQLVVVDNGKEEVVFTDADEKYKILNVIGLDVNGFAYALVGTNYDTPDGKIAKITTDKTGELKLLGQDSYMGLPAVSPSGKDILEVRFDNSESNFGFNLIKKTNSQETSIDKDEKGINYPTYSENGKVAYLKGQSGTSPTVLAIYSGNKKENVFTFGESDVVTGLNWLGEDKIIIAQEKFANNATNQGKVKILDLKTKKITDFIDLTGKERYIKSSQNGWVAMISGQITGPEDLSGNVTIFNEKDLKEKIILKAEGVVGWLN